MISQPMETPDNGNIQPRNFPDYLLTVFMFMLCLALTWSLAVMQLLLGMLVIVYIIIQLQERRIPTITHPFFLILIIYILVRIVSAIASPRPGFSIAAVINTDWVVLAVPFVATAAISLRRLTFCLQALVFSAAIAGIYGCVQFYLGYDIFRQKELDLLGNYYRATGGFNFALTFAGNQLMVFGYALAFFLSEKTRRNKMWYLVALTIIFASIIATQGRSAWLGLIFLTALGTLLINRKLFGFSIAILLLVIVSLVLISPDIQDRILSIFDPSRNEGRLNLWQTSVNMISAHPLLGVGPGRFSHAFPLYKVPGFYDATGHAHNDYLNVAAHSGLLGLLSWLAIWGGWFYYALKTYRFGKLAPPAQKIVFGSILAITGILCAAVFQCYYTDLENNIMWWFSASIGLQVIIKNTQNAPGD